MGEFADLFNEGDDKVKAAANLRFSAGSQPDAVAKDVQLGRRYNLPPALISEYKPDYEAMARVQDAQPVLEASPRLRGWLAADPTNAKVSQDDLGNLSAIEQAIRQYGEVKADERTMLGGIFEPIQRGYAQGRRGLSLMLESAGVFGGMQRQRDAARTAAGLAPEGNLEAASLLAQQQRQVERFPVPPKVQAGLQAISSATTMREALAAAVENPRAVLETSLESLGGSVPVLAGAAAGGFAGPLGTAAGAGLGSFAVEYASTLQDVMSDHGVNGSDVGSVSSALSNPDIMAAARDKALKRGIPVAVFDALTAGVAGRLLAGAKPTALSVGSRAAGELGVQAGGGAAGEATAQGVTGEYKPGDILMEALAELPTAVTEVPHNFRHTMEAATLAEARGKWLERVNQIAEASKVRERDATTFEQFVEQTSQGAPVQDVFINAQALMQSGVAEQVVAASPSVAGQLQEALVTGGDIRIPVAEYTARIAGTEYSQGLLDHLKTEPGGMSRAEAQEFMQSHSEELQRQVQEAMQAKQDDETFKASADTVKAEIKSQLDQVGRFTGGVNDAYASMVGNFYAVMAAKLGTAPDALFAKYPLRVQAEGVGGGEVLSQGGREYPMAPEGSWYGEGTYKANGGRLVYVTPDEYISTVRPLTMDDESRENIDILKQHIEDGGQLDPLLIRADGKEDGRHRAYAAKELGIARVPVIAYGDQFKSAALVSDQQLNQSQPLPATIEIDGKQRPDGSLNQTKAQGNRGSFNPSTNTITLLKNADLSTFLHEAGHFFLEVQFDISSRADAPAEVQSDTDTILKWFGVSTIDEWYGMDFEEKRGYHEQFARGFEAYLFEGKAPSIELQGVFQRFRAWLVNIYKEIKALNVELTDEVRSVFDRMLATSDEIRLAEQGRSMMPLFTSPDQAGMTPEEFKAYHDLGVQATADAIEDVQARTLRDLAYTRNSRSREIKKLQKQAEAAREAVRIDVRREVMSQPVYRAWQFLTAKGDEENPGGKLNLDALREMFASKPIAQATQRALGDGELGQPAYHGTPHRGIDKFSTDKIGTGEGAQAYGWGLYFASKREIADWYRKVLSGRSKKDVFSDVGYMEQAADALPPDATSQQIYAAMVDDGPNQATNDKERKTFSEIAEVIKGFDPLKFSRTDKGAVWYDGAPLVSELEKAMTNPGQLYEVDIPEDDTMLLWDKPLSKQPEAVRKVIDPIVKAEVDRRNAKREEMNAASPGRLTHPVLGKIANKVITVDDIKGQAAYEELSKSLGGDKAASEALSAAGIKGIKYLDGTSRNAGEGSFNYVIFSGDDVAITNQFYQSPRTAAAPTTGDHIIELLVARKMVAKDGLHPDVVAEMFGFSSGDELVRTLAAAEKPSVEIEALTDARMLEQYGELATPEAIERAADKAIHNDARARFVATEANALAKASGQRKVLASAAREFAAQMIDRLKVRDIRPTQYANAEVRAAKAAQKASQSGDLATAAAEKRNQLVNTYATRAAYAAQDEADAGVRYLKKFESDGVRKGLDADYIDQIDALLDRFDLRKGTSLTAIDKRKSLVAWVESQREQGLEPDIPDGLLDEARRQSYKDMRIDEFRGLVESVKQIEHLGRLKHRLLTAKEQKAYEAVRDEIVSSIVANADGRKADTRTPTTNMGRALQSLKQFYTSHLKAATLARVMDGGKDGGPMWEYFVRSANERGDMETTMRAQATAKLSEIMAPVFKLGKMGGKGQFFATINRSLNREARIAIALNAGNQGNLQRLLGGEGWTLGQIKPVLESLTAAEWHAVQAVWDHFESYRPLIGAKERRVYGKEPTWIDPAPFSVTTADGHAIEMRGGYYPIKYDPAASQRAEEHADAEGAKRQLQGAYTSATTRRSFTKSRAEEVSGRPLLYTLAGLYGGVNDVIHDLAWHEWLVDVNRLMRSKTIDAAIRGHYGPEVKGQFKSWIRDVAEGEQGAANAAEMAVGKLRQSVSIAGLGFNVMSAAMQPLGITQSIVRVGAPWIAKGIAQYAAHPIDAARSVNERSEFMASRSRTRFRELNELRNRVQDQSAAKEFLQAGAYFLMMRAQQMVDVPTWLGAYDKAIAEGNSDERARSLADQAVIDAQGGGQTKDLAAIERGGPFLKLFTTFYSFMNTAMNLGVGRAMTERSKARLAVDMLLLYVGPPALGYMLKQALTPGDDDLDDPEKLAKQLLAQQIDYLMGMMVVVREFSEAAKLVTGANDKGRDYSGPAGLRVISDTMTFAKQARQGEFDDQFRKASVNLVGDMFGLPSAQINRTITGTQAIAEGKTANPAALAFGFQDKR